MSVPGRVVAAGVLALAAALSTVAGGSTAAAAPVPVQVAQPADELRPGQQLPLDGLVSPNGRFVFRLTERLSNLQNPVLGIVQPATRFGPDHLFDDAIPCGIYNCGLMFEADGSLVVRGRLYERVVSPLGTGADRLVLGDDGRLRLYAGDRVLLLFDGELPQDELRRGGTLLPGERLARGDTQLVMQRDGNLVLYSGGRAAWSSRTSVPGSAFVRQTDGNAVVYTPDLRPVWATGTVGSLVLTEDWDPHWGVARLGALSGYDRVAFEVTSDPVRVGPDPCRVVFSTAWATPTLDAGEQLRLGESRTAPGGRVVTVLQDDGNLVTYRDGRAVFASRTRGADLAIMQADGNVVLYDEVLDDAGRLVRLQALWSTRTSGAGARFVTQDDGNVVVYSAAGRPLFSGL